MTISLPEDKLQSIKKAAKKWRNRDQMPVRKLAHLLGMMVAAHPAILPAPLHYRKLERAKSTALSQGRPYDQMLQLDAKMYRELSWWITSSGLHNGRPLRITTWDLSIESDASRIRLGSNCQGNATGGRWMAQERTHHIKYLKLKEAFLALKSYVREASNVSILLRLGNVIALSKHQFLVPLLNWKGVLSGFHPFC